MFSKKYGFSDSSIQIESMSIKLRKRLWTAFYQNAYYPYDLLEPELTDIEKIMLEIGDFYIIDRKRSKRDDNVQALQTHFTRMNWWEVYDFLEIYAERVISPEKARAFTDNINRILEEECSGYRFVGGEIAPIINEEEIAEIEKAIFSPFPSVESHLRKALALYSDRNSPDYDNTIKEAISAVEAMCNIIVGDQQSKATLGVALKRLQDSGVQIHKSMLAAFDKLYGYTCDEKGIRHGGIDFHEAPEEDARFMLITCSAFINYLMSKRQAQ